MEIRRPLLIFILLSTTLSAFGLEPKAIKQYPLDDRTVYQIPIAKDQITTIAFPGKISALEGSGITADPQVAALVLINYKDGRYFFSVRALTDTATAGLNVVWNRKTYVLKFLASKEPVNSVTFFEPDTAPESTAAKKAQGPERLLGLLDKVKAYHLIQAQYPNLVSQIEVTAPNNRILYPDFDVVLTEVYRFDVEDTLVFKVLFYNNSEQEIYYQPQTLAVRVGYRVYFSALSDASGIMPAGYRSPKTGTVQPSVSMGYFVVTGTSSGGRNNLSVNNKFNVIVNRQMVTAQR